MVKCKITNQIHIKDSVSVFHDDKPDLQLFVSPIRDCQVFHIIDQIMHETGKEYRNKRMNMTEPITIIENESKFSWKKERETEGGMERE